MRICKCSQLSIGIFCTEDDHKPKISLLLDKMIFNNQHQMSSTNVGHFDESELDAQKALSVGKNAGLQPFDVICGKCSLAFNNVGNRRFRVVIGMHVQRYIEAPTRSDKSRVIASVVKIFQEEIGATFVKQKEGRFVPVPDKIVRQKVGHALRDMAVYASSSGKSLPLQRSSSFHQAKRGSLSSASSSDSSSCSESTQHSTQSAPNNKTSMLPRMENKAPDLHQSMDDDSWADDLSVCSMDKPLSPLEIFPSEELPEIATIRHPTTTISNPQSLDWMTLNDQTTDNSFFETFLGNDKICEDFSSMEE